MKSIKSAYGILLATSIFSASTSFALPSNEDEASMGAAALTVLAQKCQPSQASYHEEAARKHLGYMIQRYAPDAQVRIFDNLGMKIKALQMSSAGDSCTSAVRLQSMANSWGYEHLLRSAMGR